MNFICGNWINELGECLTGYNSANDLLKLKNEIEGIENIIQE